MPNVPQVLQFNRKDGRLVGAPDLAGSVVCALGESLAAIHTPAQKTNGSYHRARFDVVSFEEIRADAAMTFLVGVTVLLSFPSRPGPSPFFSERAPLASASTLP